MIQRFLLLLLLFMVCFASMASITYDLVVSIDGTGDYTSIQQAIDATKAFPPQRVAIYVKNGRYNEKVKVHSWNTQLSLIGESADSTIITWDDHFDRINRGRNSTFHTYTMLVAGNDFVAHNLTVENSAGPVGQAVALHVEADRCVFKNLRIIGNQDALYAAGQNCRQYYTDCYIEGTTDFIFGAATALFEKCTINSKSNSFITAASTPEGTRFGYVFTNCRLTATSGVDSVYLGRPWRKYAKTVFINCEMGAHIIPGGWAVWDNARDETTTFYAEYNSFGEGACPKRRAKWSHQLSKKEAEKYTPENILKPVSLVEEEDWMYR